MVYTVLPKQNTAAKLGLVKMLKAAIKKSKEQCFKQDGSFFLG